MRILDMRRVSEATQAMANERGVGRSSARWTPSEGGDESHTPVRPGLRRTYDVRAAQTAHHAPIEFVEKFFLPLASFTRDRSAHRSAPLTPADTETLTFG